MQKTPRLLLEFILECIEIIDQTLQNMNLEDFQRDIRSQDSVIRRMQLIGQAIQDLDKLSRKSANPLPRSPIQRDDWDANDPSA